MRIIDVDLHVNPKLNALWKVTEVVEKQAPTHIIEGQKRYSEAMCKELNIYLGSITSQTQNYIFVPSTYFKI